MKTLELLEGAVIPASFGKRQGVLQDTGIKAPAGYDRFELEHKDGDASAWIVGIKGDKKTRISRAALQLAKELVKVYNSGGKSDSGIKPISMMQAFGSEELNVLHDAGIKLTEKPGYWEDFEKDGYAAKHNIHELALKKAQKALGQFKVYSGDELFGTDKNGLDKPKGPLVKPAFMPKETMFVVSFNDGTKYLVDQTGARTYFRMWQKIV